MLKCVAVCCSVLQYVELNEKSDQRYYETVQVTSRVAACCSMLQCVAVNEKGEKLYCKLT